MLRPWTGIGSFDSNALVIAPSAAVEPGVEDGVSPLIWPRYVTSSYNRRATEQHTYGDRVHRKRVGVVRGSIHRVDGPHEIGCWWISVGRVFLAKKCVIWIVEPHIVFDDALTLPVDFGHETARGVFFLLHLELGLKPADNVASGLQHGLLCRALKRV